MKPQENLSQRHKTKKKETQDDTKETEEPKEYIFLLYTFFQ